MFLNTILETKLKWKPIKMIEEPEHKRDLDRETANAVAEETSKTDVVMVLTTNSKKSHFVLVEFESNERRKLLLFSIIKSKA